MKKALSIFTISFLLSTSSFAQLEKNSWLIGGSGAFSGGFNKQVSSFGFALQPRAGIFVANKFAVGSGIGFDYRSQRYMGSATSTGMGVGISPFARYYFLKQERKFNFFAEAGFGFYQNWSTFNGFKQQRLSFSPTASVGIVYFIRPQIGIEARIIGSTDVLNPPNYNFGTRINGMIGFQIHINKPKVQAEESIIP